MPRRRYSAKALKDGILSADGLARLELEWSWQERIVEYADLRGWWAMWIPDSRRIKVKGWPDLTLIKPPRFALRECKVRGIGKVSREQEAVIDGLVDCGIDAAVWWLPEQWEEIQAWLSQ